LYKLPTGYFYNGRITVFFSDGGTESLPKRANAKLTKNPKYVSFFEPSVPVSSAPPYEGNSKLEILQLGTFFPLLVVISVPFPIPSQTSPMHEAEVYAENI
jgi:hypothetical protein